MAGRDFPVSPLVLRNIICAKLHIKNGRNDLENEQKLPGNVLRDISDSEGMEHALMREQSVDENADPNARKCGREAD